MTSARTACAALAWALVSALACGAPALAQVAVPVPVPDRANVEAAYDRAFKAMIADPANLDKAFAYAELAVQIGDLEGAIGTLERMLFIDPNLPRVKLELGVLYFRLGSYETARVYIQGALADASVPPVVRQRAESFLAQIDERLQTQQFSGSLFAGIRHQSNANSGPGGTSIRLFGQPATLVSNQSLAQPDNNAFVAGSLRHIYDFQRQGGEVLESAVNFYSAKQENQKRINVDVVALSSGPRVGAPEWLWPRAVIRPQLLFDYVALAGSVYFYAPGAGFTVSGPLLGPETGLEVSVDGRDRRYHNDAQRPFNSNQDGVVTSAQAEVTHELHRMVRLSGTARFADQQAREGSEANEEWSLGGAVNLAVPPPFAFMVLPWVFSLSAVHAVTEYDRPDPTVDPNVARRDRDWRYNLVASVPLAEHIGVIGTVGRFQRQSSLPNFAYHNRYVSLGVSWRF
jgi:tetratricopeptide (TPR) repeat protein